MALYTPVPQAPEKGLTQGSTGGGMGGRNEHCPHFPGKGRSNNLGTNIKRSNSVKFKGEFTKLCFLPEDAHVPSVPTLGQIITHL